MTFPSQPDEPWILQQILEILRALHSFQFLAGSVGSSSTEIQIKPAWTHLLSDGYIRKLFDAAQDHPDTHAHFEILGAILLRWRPLLMQVKSLLKFTRQYRKIGKKMLKHPAKVDHYLAKMSPRFNRVRQIYQEILPIADKTIEELFFPELVAQGTSVYKEAETALTSSTPHYLTDPVSLQELGDSRFLFENFRFTQFNAINTYLKNRWNFCVPDPDRYQIFRWNSSKGSWTFPLIDPDQTKCKILIRSKTGPNLARIGLHETGHCLEMINSQNLYRTMECALTSYTHKETFSSLMEGLSATPQFLQDVWKFSDQTALVFAKVNLQGLRYQSQKNIVDIKFRLEIFTQDWSIFEAQQIYTDYLEKYLGITTTPVNALQIAFLPFISGDYLFADRFASEILTLFERRFGSTWWRSPEAGEWLKTQWFTKTYKDPLLF